MSAQNLVMTQATKSMNARYLAVKAITPLLQQTSSLKYSLKANINACPEQQRAFFQELCYGSMRFYPQLEAITNQLLKKKLKNKDQDIKALIFIGLYQLYKLRTADYAAINQTVDVCEALKKPWATGLVNAALRRFQREQTQILDKLSSDISFKFNHPAWYIEKLKHNWPDNWQQILLANDQHPPLTIRVDTKKVSRETLLQQLIKQGIKAANTPYSRYGIQFEQATDITQIEEFQKGYFSVQDEAPQLAADLVAPQNGELILDACSAPGGKLLHLLEISKDKSTEIQGLEIEQHRADRIKENFDRLGLSCQLHIADACSTDWWDGRHYHKILLDTPCSATAVIRRNPDIKLMRKSEDIHSIAKLQKSILDNMWSMLATDGYLIYATCSIFQQENERLIASFCKQNQDAKHLPIDSHWGEHREYGTQVFPQAHGADGFYYAVLQKVTQH